MTSFYFKQDETYTKSEEKIIDYIYQNLSSILFMSIGQLSERLGISEATISRFARHAGYEDFKELKADIALNFGQETPAEKLAETLQHKHTATVYKLLRYQQQCIEKTIENLDQNEVDQAVEAIVSAPKIYLYGKGAATSIIKLMHFRLRRFGKQAVVLPSGGSELFEEMVHLQKKDLVILVGFQKISKEAQVILKHRKEIGYQTLLLSSRLFDSEEKRADINLYIYRGESKEYHSMTAPIALIDALIVMTASKLGDGAVNQLSELYQLKEKYAEEIPR